MIEQMFLFPGERKKSDGIFLNKKQWSKFTEEEIEKYILKVFDYYRSNGFPYFSINEEWRKKELNKLLKYDYRKCIDRENKEIKQTMHGLSYCWSYHPYHYEIKCTNKRTVFDTFNDDELLKKVIHKRIKMGDNISDNGLRKMMKIFTGTQCVSNFRPTASASIYSMFCEKGDTVWDMSFGFGGRVLGAYLTGINYIGTDPSIRAFNGVSAMCKDLDYDVRLFNIGSECDIPIDDNSIDFCLTSPPYFNTEKYSDEDTQSFIKFPSKNLWLNGFLKKTFINCHRVLKENKYMVINVSNVKSYKYLVKDTIKVAMESGFRLIDKWGLQLSSLKNGGYKTEPLLIFRKREYYGIR